VLTSGPQSRLGHLDCSAKDVSLHVEDFDIHLARGRKEHDSEILWSHQTPSPRFGINKAETELREYFLVFKFNTVHTDRS